MDVWIETDRLGGRPLQFQQSWGKYVASWRSSFGPLFRRTPYASRLRVRVMCRRRWWSPDRIVRCKRSWFESNLVHNPRATRPGNVLEPLGGYLCTGLISTSRQQPLTLVLAYLAIVLSVIWLPPSCSAGLGSGWIKVIPLHHTRPTVSTYRLIKLIIAWAGSLAGIMKSQWIEPLSGIALCTRALAPFNAACPISIFTVMRYQLRHE